MIGNTIVISSGTENKLRVIDKILVVEERRKDMARGEHYHNSGFGSSTRYLCLDLITKEILIIRPREIKKVW